MTTLESAINFIRTVNERELGFFLSDEHHLGGVLQVFEKLGRGEKLDPKRDRDKLQDHLRHFREAESLLTKEPTYDVRPISLRMQNIILNGNEVGPREFYSTLKSLTRYVELVYDPPEHY